MQELSVPAAQVFPGEPLRVRRWLCLNISVWWLCPRRREPEIRNLMRASPRARWWSELESGCGPYRWVLFRCGCRGSSGSADPCRYTVTQIHSTESPPRGIWGVKRRMSAVSLPYLSDSAKTRIILKTWDRRVAWAVRGDAMCCTIFVGHVLQWCCNVWNSNTEIVFSAADPVALLRSVLENQHEKNRCFEFPP